ncbi:OLC1v1027335C1 [Oldenlandia corymbosa var. corymbosa]|uniref:OLC1v1027335C1 n=1 Tax=Oldenlandia corymbosa var. corymbosa TaxID=529605 RepID=A0AAV1C975_OLDCO|nr:OLC1v1027335C1 [Oldenlandia corymbosa var. corymbosa]
MHSRIRPPDSPFICRISQNRLIHSCSFSLAVPISRPRKTIVSLFASYSKIDQPIPATTQISGTEAYNVKFQTLPSCKLGISRYPDFEYNAQGGAGTGTGSKSNEGNIINVNFDVNTLYIPPLTTATTRFLGLPLPPFLKIDIAPEAFKGTINQDTGKVDLEFKAKFLFSVGNLYKAPPLLVGTVLTSEESKGVLRSGRGERLDKEGKCRLVGVATVQPIDDGFMNLFLGLPTECLAKMNAVISISTV